MSTENAYALGENSREYIEGSSATLSLSLSHDCSGNPITDVTVVLPNGEGLSEADFYTKDRDGFHFGANALMGIKAKINANWGNVHVDKGDISSYYRHGVKETDTRAIQWLGGNVDNDHYDRLEFVATFPSIKEDSCVESLKIEIPTVQFCENNTLIAWIGNLDTQFLPSENTRVEEHYEPAITVVRKANNPLPEACAEPKTVTIKPSIDDMNNYLPINATASAKAQNNKASEAAASDTHPDSNRGSISLFGIFGLSLLAFFRVSSKQTKV